MKNDNSPYFISNSLGIVYRFGREYGVSWETWSNGHVIKILGEFIIDIESSSPILRELPEVIGNEICLSILQREIEIMSKSYHVLKNAKDQFESVPVFEIFAETYKPLPHELQDELLKLEELN